MKRLKTALNRIRGKSAIEVARESVTRAGRRVRRVVSRASDKRGATYISDSDLARELGNRPKPEACYSIRTRTTRRLTPGLAQPQKTAQLIAERFPDSADKTRREAEDILEHRIFVFDRCYDLGRQIDWHRDPLSNHGYPLVHFTRSTIGTRSGADPRRIWELNRLHHFTTLGRAYLLTQDERFAEEFLTQLASWYEQNPPRFGINWTVAMEAGIRAVNLLAAVDMFRASPSLTDEAIELVLKMVISHARFIRTNLENSHLGSSNHYLGDLIGLFAIAACLPELSRSNTWLRFASRALDLEIQTQVLDDGVDYEGSTGYHRLVAEMFLLGFILKENAGLSVTPGYRKRLESMFDFVRISSKPDGTVPMIGDSDDGRLLNFSQRRPNDHSYLMSVATVLFNDGRFKTSLVPDQEMIWWLGEEGVRAYESLNVKKAPESKLFVDSQIAVQRHGELYATVDCGDHGLNGRGSHAHSDALSIELYAYGQTFLKDPGTYVYSASECRRNLFRSTVFHNTVRVDREEISSIEAGSMFALGPNVKPKINSWLSSAERDLIDAEHDAYSRLTEPVIHRRQLRLEKRDEYWILTDSFGGSGEHLFELIFNVDVGQQIARSGSASIVRGDGASLAIVPVSELQLESRIRARWISPAYGTRLRSSGIIYSLRATVPFNSVMLLVPFRNSDESKVRRITDLYQALALGTY